MKLYIWCLKKKRGGGVEIRQNPTSSKVVEHETHSEWCENEADRCAQALCRQGFLKDELCRLPPRICLLVCCDLDR